MPTITPRATAVPKDACDPQEHPDRAPARLLGQRIAVRAAGMLSAMGDASRLRILALLDDGPRCVSELAEALRDPLPAISQRLRVLRAEGLVSATRRGRHVEYRLADAHVRRLLVTVLAHAAEDTPAPRR